MIPNGYKKLSLNDFKSEANLGYIMSSRKVLDYTIKTLSQTTKMDRKKRTILPSKQNKTLD